MVNCVMEGSIAESRCDVCRKNTIYGVVIFRNMLSKFYDTVTVGRCSSNQAVLCGIADEMCHRRHLHLLENPGLISADRLWTQG